MHKFNTFSRNLNVINLKIFPTHGRICKLEKVLERYKTLRSLKKYERMYPRLILKDKGDKQHCLLFYWF